MKDLTTKQYSILLKFFKETLNDLLEDINNGLNILWFSTHEIGIAEDAGREFIKSIKFDNNRINDKRVEEALIEFVTSEMPDWFELKDVEKQETLYQFVFETFIL